MWRAAEDLPSAVELLRSATNPAPPPRAKPLNLCIAAHSFAVGGGEYAPIILANALHARGHAVTYLVVDNADLRGEPNLRSRLDPHIEVFRWDGRPEPLARLFARRRIELLNSHNISVDWRLHHSGLQQLPTYVASLHGGYESTPQCLTPGFLDFIRRVDRWLYLADKNLAPLLAAGVAPARFQKSFNAVPRPALSMDRDALRSELGLSPSDFVLSVVSRATSEKGWAVAIETARRLSAAGRQVRLVLAGCGASADVLRAACARDSFVTFAGFMDQPERLLAASDLALLPSRFSGESFPLFLLESFACGLPALATDLGEIPALFGASPSARPGRLFSASLPPAALAQAMATAAQQVMDDPARHARWRNNARRISERFEVGALADLYEAAFNVAADPASPPHPQSRRSSD